MPEGALHIGREEKLVKRIELARGGGGLIKVLNDFVINISPIKIKEKVTFFRLLATMINAGITMTKSLKILAEQEKNERLKNIINDLVADIEGGTSLGDSMERFPAAFSADQIGVIRAGEATGQLNKTLLQIADSIEKSASLKAKIKGAMVYPMVILCLLVAVGIIVMILVIPKLTELFRNAGVELPLSTRVVMGISDALIGTTIGIPNVIFVIAGFIAFIGMIYLWKKTKSGKYIWDQMMLSIPIFGPLNKKVALARFCKGLATLTGSGISIIKALRINADSVGNEVYRRRTFEIAEDVKKGITIADSIKDNTKLFPVMVVNMIGIGEQTAQLDAISAKIADFYEEEVDDTTKNLSKLMEPLILVVIGLSVGGLVAAIMQPIMKISEVASQAG